MSAKHLPTDISMFYSHLQAGLRNILNKRTSYSNSVSKGESQAFAAMFILPEETNKETTHFCMGSPYYTDNMKFNCNKTLYLFWLRSRGQLSWDVLKV